ncbi:hypothetical protein M3Y98_00374300 [Aphelenchoides besseyi]|nr:hypothetical protein M3Y98_00374300 [Aphelenchoides besseyi]
MGFRLLVIAVLFLMVFAANSTKCELEMPCTKHEDCGSRGLCLNAGRPPKICRCICTQFKECENDDNCGGFRGACDLRYNFCDCDKAYRAHGLGSFF